MTYDEVVKTIEEGASEALLRAVTAEYWLSLHRWVFLPVAFVTGLAIGGM